MATKKISELEAINAAEDNDVLVIVDTSESTTNKITKGNLLIGAGHTIEMTLNENYQIVLVLKNAAGTALSTQTIDLPNENAVTNLAYNNGILTVTKQSGATSQINLTGLIEGLVTENDFNTFKEALQTTLEAINEKDAEQDEAIAENYKVINKLNEKLENQQKVINQLPQVEGQGTSITLENTIEAQFTKFEIEGNSVQDGSPSPDNEVPILSAGDNENIWNGEIERGAINGDGLDVDATNRVRNVGYYELNKGTYTLSYKGAKQSVVYIFNANKVKVNNPSWENEKSTFTLEENGYIKYALKQLDNREMNVNDVSEIKLEKGNKATPYSPYGMGSINEKIINKNVWDIDKFKNLYGTNSYETYNNVECLKLAGATQRYNFDGEENTQYTFQFKLIGSTLNSEIGAFSLVYSDGTSDYHDGILTPKTYAFTSKANKTLVRIVWNAWNAGNFIYIDKNSMQLEPGSTATPYVPHEEQDYPIFVQQPFRSIGDVRDCFVKKSDGWYERHYIGRKIFDGTESWTSQQNCFTLSINDIKPTPNYADRNQLITISNYYIGQVSGYRDAVNDLHVCKAIDPGNPRQVAIKDTSKTLAEFKAWLAEQYASGKPVYVDYLLAEPLDLPCTETQIQQLENLPSTYKDFTIIQSEDETPAYLEVSGIYDLNKLITRTEVLESEV